MLAVLAGIVWWTRQQAAPPHAGGGRNAGPMSIVPEAVGKGDIGVSLNALGTVTSLATVTIRSQISGYLMKIDFKEGDEVKKGDLIAEIDSRPYEATLAQAKGQLARDEAQLKGAQVDLTRYQNLAAQNAVPHQQLDTQVALVAQYQGTVEADRASVKSAEVNLQYCRIVSPINGRVGLRQVDLGNYVTAGDTNGLVVITQLEPISVLFTLPEDNLQAVAKRLKEGAVLPAAAYDRSGANKLAEGSLQTFDSQIDATTGTIKLRAQFENDKRTLYPNQFVNIRLLLDTHKDATTMSTAGIQRGVPGTFVYLVNADSTVSVRPVKIGVTDGDRVEVLSGLVPGDRIVIDGADKLREGAKVVVRSPADAASPAGAAKGTASGAANGAVKGDGKGDTKADSNADSKGGADPDKAGGGNHKGAADGQTK
ncbi:MdtA/MuxA family multidrug efflux RND transporter periplasmic adaptor subunit [Bradyrhizobium quebecense]|uniref:MdtA/MuxA family multidrug efflux RND transporter periplasmic adaptor subunit n=1 Tax=Bradyrhizobium quebecense TaxID=2748629 RepID=UPI001CD664F0|nr:MdtA/MuxA family multidrug efflux RND transporter periplasmic adaptor subunit [Bradyrhizobium quebecense]UGA46533.1 MdtA/MuxA family multidrug efflux RND transporter periplasmic adaptor subunit [Bradyrhizobium quebecense]